MGRSGIDSGFPGHPPGSEKPSITLRKSTYGELALFADMETQPHARPFILASSLAAHQRDFVDPRFIYLTIETAQRVAAGFFILFQEPDADSVEFRRIVVDQDQRGIGQAAIRRMERFCVHELAAKRIWLDVFADNKVGRHVYERLEYKRFKQAKHAGRTLLFYEKIF